MPIYHSCLGKIKVIWERTGVLLGHDEISTLCELWKTANAAEFMGKLNAMSDENLRSWLEKLRKRRNALYRYLESEEKIYA
jgi:hypothetical protein